MADNQSEGFNIILVKDAAEAVTKSFTGNTLLTIIRGNRNHDHEQGLTLEAWVTLYATKALEENIQLKEHTWLLETFFNDIDKFATADSFLGERIQFGYYGMHAYLNNASLRTAVKVI